MNIKKLKEELQKRLQTTEQAYNEVGEKRIDFSIFPENKRVYKEAQYDAEIIVEAARKIERECGSGEIDWSNPRQLKYIPWFVMSPLAFAFDVSYCAYSYADAGGGSRLRVLTDEAATYIGQTFSEIWEKVQLK